MGKFGEATLRHKLLGATHRDVTFAGLTRGSLVYGNATPKWDELAVGAANSVIWTDGTDVSWSTAPRLANIADTGGTNRVTLATSSPHLTLTGDTRITGVLQARAKTGNYIGEYGGASTTALLIRNQSAGENTTSGQIGISIQPSYNVTSGTGLAFVGLSGNILISNTSGTGTNIFGLDFQAIGFRGDFNEFIGAQVRLGTVNLSTAISKTVGFKVRNYNHGGSVTITDSIGLWIESDLSNARATNQYGVKIDSQTTSPNNYGLYIEDAGTYAIWSDAGLNRFDGDGTHVFELPDDAAAVGTAYGRLPIKLTGGGTKYIQLFNA